MATMTLPEVFEARLRLQALETKVNSGELSLFERCDLEDEYPQSKRAIGAV